MCNTINGAFCVLTCHLSHKRKHDEAETLFIDAGCFCMLCRKGKLNRDAPPECNYVDCRWLSFLLINSSHFNWIILSLLPVAVILSGCLSFRNLNVCIPGILHTKPCLCFSDKTILYPQQKNKTKLHFLSTLLSPPRPDSLRWNQCFYFIFKYILDSFARPPNYKCRLIVFRVKAN